MASDQATLEPTRVNSFLPQWQRYLPCLTRQVKDAAVWDAAVWGPEGDGKGGKTVDLAFLSVRIPHHGLTTRMRDRQQG